MSEIEKFYNMTKPPKFRKLRLFFRSLDSIYKVYRCKLIYLINYILYKIKILKRYSYRDMSERIVTPPYNLEVKRIKNKDFEVSVIMKLGIQHILDVDYFYRENKNGTKNITLWVSNIDENRLFIQSYLDEIHLCIRNRWYDVSQLPTFKVATNDWALKPSCISNSDPYLPTEIKTVEYDIRPLRRLLHKIEIGGCDISDLSKPRLNYYYDCSCREFLKRLDELPLNSLMRECN